MNHQTKEKWMMKPNALLFYFCYTIFIVSTMFKQVFVVGEITTQLYQICLVLLALTCIISLSRMPRKKMIFLYIITMLVLATKFITDSNILLSLWLLVVAGRNISFDDVVKYDLIIKIPALIIIPCLYFSGLTYTNIHYRGDEIRHSMGFSNPNTFSTYVMSVLVEILYLRRKKINLFDIILSVAAIFIIDYYADSQTQLVCIILIISILFINKVFKKKTSKPAKPNFVRSVTVFAVDHAFLLLLIISLCFVGAYSSLPNWSAKKALNNISHNRIIHASEMMNEYDVNLFGQKVDLVYSDQAQQTGETVKNLDNAYIYMLLTYGLITILLYAFFMKKYMQKARVEGDIIRFIMLVYLIGGLMEHFPLLPQSNIFLLYFSYVLYDGLSNKASERRIEEKNGQ